MTFSPPLCSPLGVPFPLHEENAFSALSFSSSCISNPENILPLMKIPPHFAAVFKTGETAAFVPHHGPPHLVVTETPIAVRPLLASPEDLRTGKLPESRGHELLMDFISQDCKHTNNPLTYDFG